jgi:hypothetical protein
MGNPIETEDKMYRDLERYGVRSMKDLMHVLVDLGITVDPSKPVSIVQMQAALNFFRQQRHRMGKSKDG